MLSAQMDSSRDHNSSVNVMHFKKQWLQHERSLAAAASSSMRDQETPKWAQIDGESFPFPSFPISSLLKPSPSSHASHSMGALNIPRFAKYGLPSALPPLRCQYSAGSSAVSQPDSATTFHWINAERPSAPSRERSDVTEATASKQRESSPRFMIDINKPPPSPTHSHESDVAPSTPCCAPVKDSLLPSPDLPSQVMDYSLSPAWLASARRERTSPMTQQQQKNSRSSPPSFLCHLPALETQASDASTVTKARNESVAATPLQKRQGSGVLEGRRKSSSPVSVLARETSSTPSPARRPRVTQQPWEEESTPAVHHPFRFSASRRVLDVTESHKDEDVEENSQEDGEIEGGEEDGEDRELGSKRGQEEVGSGGAPKACLHCGTTRTPLWRNGPPGPKSLCNACGIRFNKIRSGKRRPTPKEASMLRKYERSSSMSSGVSEVAVRGSSGVSHHQKQRERERRPQFLELPVATLHKSRSKLSRIGSCSVVSRKREAMEEEGDMTLAASAFKQPPKKRQTLGLLSSVRAQSSLHGVRIQISRSSDEDNNNAGSSSDHESCLSEPPHSRSSSPSPPQSPVASNGKEDRPWLPKAGRGPPSSSPLRMVEDADVEAGARLLMEIFHSAPMVSC